MPLQCYTPRSPWTIGNSYPAARPPSQLPSIASPLYSPQFPQRLLQPARWRGATGNFSPPPTPDRTLFPSVVFSQYWNITRALYYVLHTYYGQNRFVIPSVYIFYDFILLVRNLSASEGGKKKSPSIYTTRSAGSRAFVCAKRRTNYGIMRFKNV